MVVLPGSVQVLVNTVLKLKMEIVPCSVLVEEEELEEVGNGGGELELVIKEEEPRVVKGGMVTEPDPDPVGIKVDPVDELANGGREEVSMIEDVTVTEPELAGDVIELVDELADGGTEELLNVERGTDVDPVPVGNRVELVVELANGGTNTLELLDVNPVDAPVPVPIPGEDPEDVDDGPGVYVP